MLQTNSSSVSASWILQDKGPIHRSRVPSESHDGIQLGLADGRPPSRSRRPGVSFRGETPGGMASRGPASLDSGEHRNGGGHEQSEPRALLDESSGAAGALGLGFGLRGVAMPGSSETG